jgi:hypothetical protein
MSVISLTIRQVHPFWACFLNMNLVILRCITVHVFLMVLFCAHTVLDFPLAAPLGLLPTPLGQSLLPTPPGQSLLPTPPLGHSLLGTPPLGQSLLPTPLGQSLLPTPASAVPPEMLNPAANFLPNFDFHATHAQVSLNKGIRNWCSLMHKLICSPVKYRLNLSQLPTLRGLEKLSVTYVTISVPIALLYVLYELHCFYSFCLFNAVLHEERIL